MTTRCALASAVKTRGRDSASRRANFAPYLLHGVLWPAAAGRLASRPLTPSTEGEPLEVPGSPIEPEMPENPDLPTDEPVPSGIEEPPPSGPEIEPPPPDVVPVPQREPPVMPTPID